jgi:hypothetical protein|nr:MAG TPA: hypothetical protein [Caudoviricetes sp.]
MVIPKLYTFHIRKYTYTLYIKSIDYNHHHTAPLKFAWIYAREENRTKAS